MLDALDGIAPDCAIQSSRLISLIVILRSCYKTSRDLPCLIGSAVSLFPLSNKP